MRKCHFIGGHGNKFCRRVFHLPRRVVSAVVKITADPHSYAMESWQLPPDGDANNLLGGSFIKFRLFLDGRLLGIGPFRAIVDGNSVEHSFKVGHLSPGNHVIAVISRGEKHGFALELTARYEDGSVFELDSSQGFREIDANAIYEPVCWEKPNIYNYFKGDPGPGEYFEHINGNRYPGNWHAADFNDQDWSNCRPHPAQAAMESVDSNYQLEDCAAVEIKKTGDGRYFIDFGREAIGGLVLTGPAAGGKVEVRLGEELLQPDCVRYQMRTGNCYQELWQFCSGKQELAHFGIRAFRYAELVGYNDELTAAKIRRQIFRALFDDQAANVTTSNDDLNRVWELCKYSIKATALDVYADCWSRERIAYEADSYINMLSHFATGNGIAIARRTLEYQMHHPNWPCEWRQFMIPLFYEYAMHTGDLELIARSYHKLRDECSFFNLIDRGLIHKFPMKIIIDWPESCRDNYEFGDFCGVPNAFLYWNLGLMSELAVLLDKTSDHVEFIRLAGQVKTAFNHKLFNHETGLYIDSENSSHSSFHVNMFALRFGLVPEERIEKCLDFIIGKGMVCSVYAAQFYLDALFMHNRADEAVSLLTADNDASWLGMIRRGATITTEAWYPEQKANMSWAHPWAASPANVIVRHLFGLRPTAPGWSKYEFNPQPGGISSAKIKIQTPGGTLNAGFKHDKNGRLVKEIAVIPPMRARQCEKSMVDDGTFRCNIGMGDAVLN